MSRNVRQINSLFSRICKTYGNDKSKLLETLKIVSDYLVVTRGKNTPSIKNAIDLIFVDHGIFRFKWRSLYQISNNVYRSNQPFPWQIIADKKKRGVKTIINLRGIRHCSSYYLEKETCDQNGIKLINFPVTSRATPKAETILEAKELFKNIEYPIIMHCKSGADRAGLMSALYLILNEKKSVKEAKNQLSFKYLHLKYAKTGILDAFFDSYLNLYS